MKGLVVTFKGIYLFVWFLTFAALFTRFNDKDLQRIMVVWSCVSLLHGGLIIAQFLSPEIWEFTSNFAGYPMKYDIYRSSGLFICEDAGCANKAAFFQLISFVPLLLARFSKRITVILGIFLLSSMLPTGSMGSIVAFIAGLTISMIAVIFLGKITVRDLMNLLLLLIAIAFFGGLFYLVASQNESFQEHLQGILLERADRSSSGRFDLWQDGIDHLLEHNIPVWGVGPENFRIFGEKGKQLHNDMLAFVVERGLIGLLGLVLLGVIAIGRAFYLFIIHSKSPQRSQIVVVVFLAAMIATLVESLTHQIFHARQVWLVLALQEAMLYKAMKPKSGLMQPSRSINGLPQNDHVLPVQPDTISGMLI
jgi:O-antigen ligase